MKKLPCKCGHTRSSHRYIYNGDILSVRSPCNKCGIRKRNIPTLDYITHEIMGSATVSEPRCNYYDEMDNLRYAEWLADKKNLV